MWNYINKNLIIPILTLVFLFNPLGVIGSTLTFGKTTNDPTGSINDSGDYSIINSATPTMSGTIKSGEARIWLSSAGSTTVRLVIYSDNSGVPNSLLATSDELTITNTTEQSKVFTFTGNQQINVVQGTTYWIGVFHADPGSINIHFSADIVTGTIVYYNADTYAGGAESTYTIDGSIANDTLDLFISYESPEGISYPLINPNLYDSGLRVDYDGVDERSYKDTPSFNDDDSGSWCAWINHDTTLVSNDFESIFGLGGSDTDQATAFGRIVFGIRYATSQDNVLEVVQVTDGGSTNRVGGSTKLNGGTNYLVCVTSNSSDWDFYVNGTAETESIILGSNNGNWFNDVGTVGTRRAGIGDLYRDGVWSGNNFDGKIDNVMVWTSELGSTELTRLYNSGKPVHPCAVDLCSTLDTYIKMGESDNGTITTLYDSKNFNNFTSDNMENADIVTTSYY